MIKNIVFGIIIFAITFNVKAKETGYFNTSNGSEYLDFSNMNKEFSITSLMNSAIANDFKAAEIFIASGADVNQKNISGATALHLAARNNSYETAKILIKHGAKINEKDIEGWTPFMRASLAGDTSIMTLFIQNGVDLWSVNQNQETALLHTAMADCFECGKLILNNFDKRINNNLKKDQIKQSLQIVNKRYNKPFIELLKGDYPESTPLSIDISQKNDKKLLIDNQIMNNDYQEANITQLVYIFTGKTLSIKELDKIGNENHKNSIKNEKKLNNKSKIIIQENNAKLEEKSKKSKSITNSTSNNSKNNINSTNKDLNNTKINNKENSLNLVDKKIQNKKIIYELNSSIAKPIVDKKDRVIKKNKKGIIKMTQKTASKTVKATQNNTVQKVKNKTLEITNTANTTKQNSNKVIETTKSKYKLNSNIAKPIIDKKDIKKSNDKKIIKSDINAVKTNKAVKINNKNDLNSTKYNFTNTEKK